MSFDKIDAQIYVACLAAYNEGHLHGVHIDLADMTDAEDIRIKAREMLKTSPATRPEEYVIHDYESFPNMGETSDFERVFDLYEKLSEYSEEEAEIILENMQPSEILDPETEIHSIGVYKEKGDALEAHGYLEGVPSHIEFYLDTDAMFDNMFADAATGRTSDNSVYVLKYS